VATSRDRRVWNVQGIAVLRSTTQGESNVEGAELDMEVRAKTPEVSCKESKNAESAVRLFHLRVTAQSGRRLGCRLFSAE